MTAEAEPTTEVLEANLGWLADAPLFIDGDRIDSLYDAVVHPEYEQEQVKLETLSENCQVEQYMGTGQLNQCQPVLRLLGPARAQAATLAQPGDRPLHHPSPRPMRLPMRGLPLL